MAHGHEVQTYPYMLEKVGVRWDIKKKEKKGKEKKKKEKETSILAQQISWKVSATPVILPN